MIKMLHSADWHLDAPMQGFTEAQRSFLRAELRKVPEKVARLCRANGCQVLLLAGDLFDGSYSADTLHMVQQVLGELQIPVLISPGNHDHLGPGSPYEQPGWPENVHIFREQKMTCFTLEALGLQVWGAGYTAMDCPGLLEGFRAEGSQPFQIGLLHGDPETASAYCPITKQQLRDCGLKYLALGHIHKADSLRAGDTACAWPGCPMGRGFDELEAKGVILVTLDGSVSANFINLDTPRFMDMEIEAGEDAAEALSSVLPALPSSDFFRVTLTGYSTGVDLAQLQKDFAHIPNLTLRDATRPEMDLWSAVGEDTLEGVYFSLLQDATHHDNATIARRAALAARISRHILDSQEVKLP